MPFGSSSSRSTMAGCAVTGVPTGPLRRTSCERDVPLRVASDPGDESILFAISMPCGDRGALPASYKSNVMVAMSPRWVPAVAAVRSSEKLADVIEAIASSTEKPAVTHASRSRSLTSAPTSKLAGGICTLSSTTNKRLNPPARLAQRAGVSVGQASRLRRDGSCAARSICLKSYGKQRNYADLVRFGSLTTRL